MFLTGLCPLKTKTEVFWVLLLALYLIILSLEFSHWPSVLWVWIYSTFLYSCVKDNKKEKGLGGHKKNWRKEMRSRNKRRREKSLWFFQRERLKTVADQGFIFIECKWLATHTWFLPTCLSGQGFLLLVSRPGSDPGTTAQMTALVPGTPACCILPPREKETAVSCSFWQALRVCWNVHFAAAAWLELPLLSCLKISQIYFLI